MPYGDHPDGFPNHTVEKPIGTNDFFAMRKIRILRD